MNMTASIKIEMAPSSSASIKLLVRVLWMFSALSKRDMMSPKYRFSKNVTGSRIRWAKRFCVPLDLQRGTEIECSPAPQSSQKCLQPDQKHESDAKGHQQVPIPVANHFVHRELQEQRADQGK